MQTNLILVHTGNRFPHHINDCIDLANRCNFKIHLILEENFQHLIKSKNVVLITLNQVIDDRYSNYTLKNYNSEFRDGFFPRTSSRFILIDNYIKQNNTESFFHIENDIAIFSNLFKTQEYLYLSEFDTAIIMDSPLRCVPSVIWYKNSIASNRMSNFIYSNNNLDDMKNLAIYFHKNRDKVTNLPIVPFDLIDKSSNTNFGNMYNELGTIFDGAAIGQYLYGIDTIDNYTNIDTKGFINETCVFDVSQYQITTKKHQPIMNHLNKEIPINNLHIHSKNFKGLL